MKQTKCPNVYPALPGNYRSFRTTDGLVICWRCNQVEHFACACPGNLPPPRAPTHYQNHRHNYVRPTISSHPLPIAPHPLSPINILNALPIDHTPIDTTLWAILTRQMPPTPIPHDDYPSHPPIKPTTSTKLEDLTFRAKTTIIVTWFKMMLYRTGSALYQAL